MDSRILRYFMTIAETGNISKAAELLHITQPTLSRQLKSLEEELGSDLFIRTSQGLTLTEAGMYFKDRSREILALTDKTLREFTNQTNSWSTGNLSIGLVEVGSSPMFLKTLQTFTDKYPNATFTFYSNTGDEILDRLDKGLLDCAIVINPIDISKYNYINVEIEECWGVYLNKQHPFATLPVITPDDLVQLKLLTSSRIDNHTMIHNWMGSNKMSELNIQGYYNLILNVVPLVRENLYSVLAIKGLEHVFDKDEVVFIPLAPTVSTSCVFVWKKDTIMTSLLHQFIKILDSES